MNGVSMYKRLGVFVIGAILAGCGCREQVHDGHDHAEDEFAPIVDDISVPPSVRENLGIEFVTVERRVVQSTVRVPGQFELRPEARRDYHVMLSGRIDLSVAQFQEVAAGDVLFRLDSPEWHKMKSDLAASMNAMKRSHADLAVAEARSQEALESIEFLEQRITNLAEANVRRVELEAARAEKRNMLPRLQAEVAAAQTQFDAAHTDYDVFLNRAASVSGVPRAQLGEVDDGHGHMDHNEPPWQTINLLTFRAESPGIIDVMAITNRGWAEAGVLVLSTIDPSNIRFHADALQSDIAIFETGQAARIVPPQGSSIPLGDAVEGQVTVGYQAHPDQRTIPLFMDPPMLPSWAKPGIRAYLEVVTRGDEAAVMAIPEGAVIRDGLNKIFFLRDRDDPDTVIRVTAYLGASDGRWIEVKSGIELGDEVVLGGVYPLMLASSQSSEIQAGGHYHPDGTFHEDH